MTMIKAVEPITGELGVQHLVDTLVKEKERKLDYELSLNKIRVNKDLKFESDETGEFSFSEKGFKQLCQNISEYTIPYDYMMNLYEHDKEQFASLINWHLKHAKDTEKKLRGIKGEDGLNIRGIVSPKFQPFDNLDALETFMTAMKFQGIDDYQIKTSTIKEDFMFLRFMLPSTMQSFGKTVDGKEDWNYMAMDLINGETGNSTLKLVSSAYRQVCTNGMVALDVIDSLNKRHVGQEKDFINGMTGAIRQGIAIGDKTLQELAMTKKILVDNPYEVITKYAKQLKLSDSQQKTVRENYEIEPERNVMSIINAFTRTARDLKSIDKRIQMEKFASHIMEKELKRLK